MSYNNLNNFTPFGFRDSISLVTNKVQEIQVGYYHPYRISLTGSNLTYTAADLLNKSIVRTGFSSTSLDFLPPAVDIVSAVNSNSYIGFTPGMYFDVSIKNDTSNSIILYPSTGVIAEPSQINANAISYIRLTLNSTGSVNATVISSYVSTGAYPSPTGGSFTGAGVQGPQGLRGLQGFQGLVGSTGSSGLQGLQGLRGSTGSSGLQGFQGSKGDVGQGFIIFASTTSYTGLNSIIATGGNVGEFVLVTGGDLFVYAGTGVGSTGPGNSYQYAGDITDESKLVGLQGLQGSVGTQGFAGVQGLQGYQGLIGLQGLQGTIGLQGLRGTTGSDGLQGLVGSTGSSGLQGLQGLRGTTGSDGLQGLQGLRGSTGAQGLQGFQGLQGLQGLVGSTGSSGLQGLQGLRGTTGSDGLQGLQGLIGSTGSSGLQGLAGSTGSSGLQGLQGLVGSTGSSGLQGLQGLAGSTGSSGLQGYQGLIGSTGSFGLQGLQGLAGSTGSSGLQGLQGLIGTTGARGFQGLVGSTGSSGLQGSLGLQGYQGIKGDVGQGFYIFATTPSYTGLNTIIATGGNIGEFVLITGGDLFYYVGTGAGSTGPGNSYNYAGDITDESKLIGLQGSQGSIGPQGSLGPQGLAGTLGLQGFQGLVGPTGSGGSALNIGTIDVYFQGATYLSKVVVNSAISTTGTYTFAGPTNTTITINSLAPSFTYPISAVSWGRDFTSSSNPTVNRFVGLFNQSACKLDYNVGTSLTFTTATTTNLGCAAVTNLPAAPTETRVATIYLTLQN